MIHNQQVQRALFIDYRGEPYSLFPPLRSRPPPPPANKLTLSKKIPILQKKLQSKILSQLYCSDCRLTPRCAYNENLFFLVTEDTGRRLRAKYDGPKIADYDRLCECAEKY